MGVSSAASCSSPVGEGALQLPLSLEAFDYDRLGTDHTSRLAYAMTEDWVDLSSVTTDFVDE